MNDFTKMLILYGLIYFILAYIVIRIAKYNVKRNKFKYKKIKKQIKDDCDHDWIQTSLFVLDGYTKYRCRKCDKNKTEGYTLDGK